MVVDLVVTCVDCYSFCCLFYLDIVKYESTIIIWLFHYFVWCGCVFVVLVCVYVCVCVCSFLLVVFTFCLLCILSLLVVVFAALLK